MHSDCKHPSCLHGGIAGLDRRNGWRLQSFKAPTSTQQKHNRQQRQPSTLLLVENWMKLISTKPYTQY